MITGRTLTQVQPVTEETSLSTSMSNEELLDRLTSIQEELRRIRNVLRGKIKATSGNGSRLTAQRRVRYSPATAYELRA